MLMWYCDRDGCGVSALATSTTHPDGWVQTLEHEFCGPACADAHEREEERRALGAVARKRGAE